MNFAETLFLALLLDAVAGEPRALWSRIPHPAILMGRAVGWADTRFNSGAARKAKGIATMAALGLVAVTVGYGLSCFGWLVELLVAAILLAQRSLVDHVAHVANGLRLSAAEGRRAVARIVGRDTRDMDNAAISRAAIESAAENFSDGVVAPAFWYLIGGLPGLLLYKITNTADSMIGYRTPRHEDFGWAAARLDDVLNVVPARLTAVIIALTHGILSDWSGIRADARQHRSPNAGWPEAAMSRALGVALSGPRAYEGQMRDYPFVNASGHQNIGPDQIDSACTALWRSWLVLLAVTCLIALL